MQHELHNHSFSEMRYGISAYEVIVDLEFKDMFSSYRPMPQMPYHIIVSKDEYDAIKFKKIKHNFRDYPL